MQKTKKRFSAAAPMYLVIHPAAGTVNVAILHLFVLFSCYKNLLSMPPVHTLQERKRHQFPY